ncbi:hypothetical protein HELRODRAFT_95099 [Helobdella robusta]|uniref:Transmembrane protein 45B n=1 Tax=Helobdella robusta TaxID=6412 RepID=T1G945_HELRO|nr:hypothetical protein HELRODRAFT_95099 [Helobdella robusta]ESN99147.1 hypothetical protein HELRODRAFT_95099 [Helobdella robusta]
MGTFGGHALPGSFFIIFSLWWTVQTFRRYYKSLKKGSPPYKSSVTFKPDCLPCEKCKNLELEGILKVAFTTLGLVLEVITAYKDGHFTHLGNGQHATMFFFFGLSGVVDILMHHGAPLPENTDYAISCLSFIVEDVLFMFHLHGRTKLDVILHTLLLYVVHACVICVLFEVRFRNNVVVALARSFLVLLQGTWFWQVGFILYNPNPNAIPWKDEDHNEIMLATMIFAWHLAIDFILILVIGLLVKMLGPFCCLAGTNKSDGAFNHVRYDQVKLITTNAEINHLPVLDESESEEEFNATKP